MELLQLIQNLPEAEQWTTGSGYIIIYAFDQAEGCRLFHSILQQALAVSTYLPCTQMDGAVMSEFVDVVRANPYVEELNP